MRKILTKMKKKIKRMKRKMKEIRSKMTRMMKSRFLRKKKDMNIL